MVGMMQIRMVVRSQLLHRRLRVVSDLIFLGREKRGRGVRRWISWLNAIEIYVKMS